MQVSRERFTITLLALPADQPETLRNLKVFLLTEMGLSVDEAQSLLYSLPKDIFQSDSEEQIKTMTEQLKNFGADFEVKDSEAEVIKEMELRPKKQTPAEKAEEAPVLAAPAEALPVASAPVKEVVSEKDKHTAVLTHIEAPQLKIMGEHAQDNENYQIHRPAKVAAVSVDLKLLQAKHILTNSIIGVSLAAVISLISYYIFIVGDENLFKEVFSRDQVEQIIKTSEEVVVAQDNKSYTHTFFGKKTLPEIKVSLRADFFDTKLDRLEFDILPVVHHTSVDPTAIPPLKIEKILGENFIYRVNDDGSFFIKGTSKVFLEDLNNKFRLPADSVISGKLNSENNTVKLRLLINRGFQDSPRKNVLDVNQRDVNNSRFYIDLDMLLDKKNNK